MFRNYFKTAFRNLAKNKGFSAINIAGLAVGLATCLLITLYVLDELSYDRFNKNADRIFRVDQDGKFGGNRFILAVSPPPMGPALVKDFQQVEQYVRLQNYGPLLVKKDDQLIREEKAAYADSTLFDVFTLPMIAGNPKIALTAPRSLVITEKIALKYFGRTDVTGQQLFINNKEQYTITGVIRNLPSQSHFHYDFFIAMAGREESRFPNWYNQNYHTYILLKPGVDYRQVDAQLDEWVRSYTNPGSKKTPKNADRIRTSLMPLLNIHLYSDKLDELEPNGNITYVYIFSTIAVFILLIACVNFMNLSTARSTGRAKEVGIRKVLGSMRSGLIKQFIAEAILVSMIALILALILTGVLLPWFNQLSGKDINFALFTKPWLVFCLLLLALLTGLVAGSYPAFYLSAFRPIQTLKGALTSGFRKSYLRNGLVVFQFWISIVLIVSTITIYRQLNHIQTQKLGFNRQQVLVVQNTSYLGDNAKSFKESLLKISGVEKVTTSGYLPVTGSRNNSAFYTSPAFDQKTAITMQKWAVDEDYIPTLEIELESGRNFIAASPADSNAIIINEAAARFLGMQDLVNSEIYKIKDNTKNSLETWRIVGVVKNFNFSSLKEQVKPLALTLRKQNASMALRISEANTPALLDRLEKAWKKAAPGYPFSYSFMDDEYNNLYKAEQRMGSVAITFSILAIMIACLGLLGLVTYSAEQRTKEIGIRKLLGASIKNIVGLLSKDFMRLIVLATVIAFPVSWWIMQSWLQHFAYRVQIGWWVFLLAGAAALLIAIVTISFQAIKAAIANPVKALKNE